MFFKIGETLNEKNESVKVLTYSLNTLPATSQILIGIKEKQMTPTDDYLLNVTQYNELAAAISQINYLQKLRWTVLDDSFTGTTIDHTEIQESLDKIIK
jgi:hypothetical protein